MEKTLNGHIHKNNKWAQQVLYTWNHIVAITKEEYYIFIISIFFSNKKNNNILFIFPFASSQR